MPKMKTRRSVAKRFRVTGGGKIKRTHAFRSHLLTARSRKRKRRLGLTGYLVKGDEDRVRKGLPYA